MTPFKVRTRKTTDHLTAEETAIFLNVDLPLIDNLLKENVEIRNATVKVDSVYYFNEELVTKVAKELEVPLLNTKEAKGFVHTRIERI